jgi:LPXTG-motif cell wall-anchored protein
VVSGGGTAGDGVNGSATGGGLADTGTDSPAIVAGALAALALGATLVIARRRLSVRSR